MWAQVPWSLEHRKHSWARPPVLDIELGKLGFAHHPISSGPSSSAHVFSPFPCVLIIYVKTPLCKETQRHFEMSWTHCFVKFVLSLIRLSVYNSSTFSAEQGLSFTTWAITKPQGGFRLLTADEPPPGGAHRCDHPQSAQHKIIFTKQTFNHWPPTNQSQAPPLSQLRGSGFTGQTEASSYGTQLLSNVGKQKRARSSSGLTDGSWSKSCCARAR